MVAISVGRIMIRMGICRVVSQLIGQVEVFSSRVSICWYPGSQVGGGVRVIMENY